MKIPAPMLTVAKHLGPLAEKAVFVGGMIRGLLTTDPAAGPARPTDDVDLIVDVPTYKAFTDLGDELRELGFSESMEDGAPICRWTVAGIRADIMPIDPGVLGFSNVWYAGAMDCAVVLRGPDGNIRILDAPHFCDTRQSLADEIASSSDDVRTFIAEVVSQLLETSAFIEMLPGHLEGDAGSQARLPILLARLQRIGASGATKAAHLPSTSIVPTAMPLLSHPRVPAPGMPFSAPSGWVALRSSNLRAVQYEQQTQTLTVEFRSGGVYTYSGVPATIFQGLLGAYSSGRYHHQWIRQRYPHHGIR